MGAEPLRIKPHHAEGAQRFIAWGKENHREMYELFTTALEENTDAEVIFIRGVDHICASCILEGSGSERCATSADIVNIDVEVAREHGWEFDKPYKVKDILDELRAEAPDREIFYICKLTREEHERWLSNIRESKKRATD